MVCSVFFISNSSRLNSRLLFVGKYLHYAIVNDYFIYGTNSIIIDSNDIIKYENSPTRFKCPKHSSNDLTSSSVGGIKFKT